MRLSLRKPLAAFLAAAVSLLPLAPAYADVYHATPKLVVILVIDQFRGDLLERYRDDLKAPNGFNLFLKRGAYFNNCYYDYANTKTAPGHASIGTGAYTDGHSIASNEWWDLSRNTARPISSVEDERYRLVGTFDDLPAPPPGQPLPTAPRIGSSPRNLLATTIGDEVRLATQGESRVYGISLKDRAAIMPSGQSANAAYWIDNATGRFVTSTYYMPQLPAWVTAFNKGQRPKQAIKDAGLDDTTQFYALVGRMPAANAYELDFAEDLIQKRASRSRARPPTFSPSRSRPMTSPATRSGPDSDQQRDMVLSPRPRSRPLLHLTSTQKVGLANVVVAITADHGIAPIPAEAARLGISAASLNLENFMPTRSTKPSTQRFPQGGGKLHYLLPAQELPYIARSIPASSPPSK